ncbi:MAG: sigma-E factor negative regulatory protein [Pseudohongiella sp.]|nr:sigma-E factor negative regulatory protein [Pseudohongiella sp.]MDO9519615.1 sigma-E factor negative regulatory protein [Pseudohongiella sp.]MDP2127690.1 sigma-E factor negative regulatory protein [Pseudohongiella sp.]
MSDRIQVDGEALSALMDGELSEFELRRLLARISDEPELLATWERYNLVRAVYQPEPLSLQVPVASGMSSLSERIMAAIEAEPAIARESDTGTTRKVSGSAWASQVAKFAVAASVALAVFVGMQSILDVTDAPSVASRNPAESVAPTGNGNVQLAVDEDAQRRLNEYIRSVSIPSSTESSGTPFNILLESPMLHPVSDLELIQEVERTNP